MSGLSVSEKQGVAAVITPAVVTAGTAENPTAIRCEAQLLDGSVKSAAIELADGDGGVYVEAVRSCYATTPYATVGRRMIAQDDSAKADGTTAYSIASTFWTSGYGVCNLAVALPDDASTGPATAVWNGGDPASTASWTCKAGDGTTLAGMLPDKHTQILISANVTMTADADLTPYASVMTTAANLTINTTIVFNGGTEALPPDPARRWTLLPQKIRNDSHRPLIRCGLSPQRHHACLCHLGRGGRFRLCPRLVERANGMLD